MTPHSSINTSQSHSRWLLPLMTSVLVCLCVCRRVVLALIHLCSLLNIFALTRSQPLLLTLKISTKESTMTHPLPMYLYLCDDYLYPHLAMLVLLRYMHLCMNVLSDYVAPIPSSISDKLATFTFHLHDTHTYLDQSYMDTCTYRQDTHMHIYITLSYSLHHHSCHLVRCSSASAFSVVLSPSGSLACLCSAF